jgi:epoxyqueuosine reductase
MDPGRLRQELEAEAKSAGLDAIAVARADVLDRDRARLEQWIARGQQSGMTWMARDPARRADPRALLEG